MAFRALVGLRIFQEHQWLGLAGVPLGRPALLREVREERFWREPAVLGARVQQHLPHQIVAAAAVLAGIPVLAGLEG